MFYSAQCSGHAGSSRVWVADPALFQPFWAPHTDFYEGLVKGFSFEQRLRNSVGLTSMVPSLAEAVKRRTPSHPKTFALASLLAIPRAHAVGLLECLFQWAGDYARRGDIGRHTNPTISDGAGWVSDPDGFVQALLASRWIDECACHRLRVHDWPEHCETGVKKTAEVKAAGFLECYSSSIPQILPNPPNAASVWHKAQGTGKTAEGNGTGQLEVIRPTAPYDPNDPMSVARAYLGCFNIVFGRKCSVTPGVAEKVRVRLTEIRGPAPKWHAWHIVSQPIMVYANTRDASFREQIMPEWPLRDGRHRSSDGGGRTTGATDWLEREFSRADRTVLDPRLAQIAQHLGVLEKLQIVGVGVRQESGL